MINRSKIWPGIFLVSMAALAACEGGKSSKDEDAPIIAPEAKRSSTVTLASAKIPDGQNGYLSFGGADFVNGAYGQDVPASPLPPGLDVKSEEGVAATNGIFLSGPGLIWKIDPPMPVTVTLSARGRSQTINREPRPSDGTLAVSLYSFPDVFPPAYRERYEIVIKSIPGTLSPFSFTYTFAVLRGGAAPVMAVVSTGDTTDKILLGRDTPAYTLAKITTSIKCDGCAIDLTEVTAQAVVKKFTELPSLPVPGPLRIAMPRRYSGLIVSSATTRISAQAVGNGTTDVKVVVSLPASLTTVQPWCAKRGNPTGACHLTVLGTYQPTYFRFLNALPNDPQIGLFGGIEGVAQLTVSGEAKLSVKRDGKEVEVKKVQFDGGVVSALGSQTVPPWVLDEIRSSLLTGAPEFADTVQ